MQISALIIENIIFHYIPANIEDNWQKKVFRPMLLGSATIIKLFLTRSYVSMIVHYAN